LTLMSFFIILHPPYFEDHLNQQSPGIIGRSLPLQKAQI
jgi:hypothetical protein